MEMEITIPDELPVMTLPNITLFPQALLPLHIFEPRYRQMLKDVLATNRLFAVAGIDPKRAEEPLEFEPPHRIASVGIVRACQESENGTSNLLLQGICRVELLGTPREDPYRRMRVRTLVSVPGPDAIENDKLRAELMRLFDLKEKLGATIPADIAGFLRGVEDPEAFVDIAAFNLCDDPRLRQRLLETLDLNQRLRLFAHRLRRELHQLKLRVRLQGGLADDRIDLN